MLYTDPYLIIIELEEIILKQEKEIQELKHTLDDLTSKSIKTGWETSGNILKLMLDGKRIA